MEPAAYLARIRAPVLELLILYVRQRDLLPADDSNSARDVRQFLGRILSALQDQLDPSKSTPNRERYVHERRLLAFLAEILNTHAHEHQHDSQSLALGVLASLAIFIKSANLTYNIPRRRIEELEVELLTALVSEYDSRDDEDLSTESTHSLQIEALHDKIDNLIGFVMREKHPPTEVPQNSPPQNTRRRLEEIRRAIEEDAVARGRVMEGYHHLLQFRWLNDLINENPQSMDELSEWTKRLSQYERNKPWLEMQIRRWGNDILSALNNKS